MRITWRLSLLLLIVLTSPAGVAKNVSHLPVPLRILDWTVPHAVFAIYPLPGGAIPVAWQDGGAGRVRYLGQEAALGSIALRAPAKPGLTVMEVSHARSGKVARVHVLTRVPAGAIDSKGFLQGYRIGQYPATPLRGQQIYQKPRGFVRVTAQNVDTLVSPNFRLGQFVSKQQGGYPKFLVLQPGLLLKLETILGALRAEGLAREGLVIMSGYRTPFYNRAIGNVAYSRHVWGGAADVYIDEQPRDGRMDDVNGDGRINVEDARWFASLVERLSRDGAFEDHIGGLGVYGANAAHGPFIHVDVRGSRARW